MITRKNYLLHIYDVLFGYEYIKNVKKPDLTMPDSVGTKRISDILEILNAVEKKYLFNMQQMFKLNVCKFSLWQQCMCDAFDIRTVFAASEFVAFCCLVDKFLDSKRFSDGFKDEIASGFLHISEIKHLGEKSGKYLDELRALWNIFVEDVYSVPYLENQINMITEYLSAAFVSEEHLCHSKLQEKETFIADETELLTDKSTKFVTASFLISDISGSYLDRIEIFDIIGQLFCIVDDICDLIEDVENRRKNSLLFTLPDQGRELVLSERVEMTVSRIDTAVCEAKTLIQLLNDDLSVEMFDFIMWEVHEWGYPIRKELGKE